MATSITVAQALAYENDPSTIPAGAVFDIVDVAANIESLTASEISGLQSIGVTSIKSTDGLVKVDPTGAKETAFANANIPITADITVAKALSLETTTAASGTPVLVPPDERVTVVGTAAELEALTKSQLKALGAIIDTTASGGTDSGKSAVHKIAATDAPPVFTAADMTALGNDNIAVVAPPNDPTQNDGTAIIAGRGMTFDITWDSSVASAPTAFKTDVEEVFQLYADTYSGATGSPLTLYYHVGFGEVDNQALSSSDLGESDYFHSVGESYATVLAQLTADATSPAQLAALATLPATDPTSNSKIGFSPAEAQVLGFANAPTSSATDPDGYVGFSDNTDWNYDSNANQTPLANAYDFLGTVEHEISEIMGRTSAMGGSGETTTGDFSLLDLYRYSAADTRALTPFADPSYFSIDDGVTNLGDWNNFTTGNSGDLGDWSGTTVNGVVKHTADAYNDNSDPDVNNPFTATDATLMNVLGYDLTGAPPSPIALPSTDVTLSTGQLLEDITLNEIDPGSVNPPAGDSYVVIDTAFDIESITPAEFTQGLSIGVGEFIVDGGIANLRTGQVTALSGTPFLAILTVTQALALEANPPFVPANETVMIVDTAADIETLTASDISALLSIGVTSITATDAPVTFTPGGPEQAALTSTNIPITADINVATALSLEAPALSSGPTLLVPPTEHIIVVDTATNLEGLSIGQLDALATIADTATSGGLDSGTNAVTQIAGSDAPPVFSAVQMQALAENHIAVVAPPNDPVQNDGTVTITGRGTTFVVTFDSSVASAPAAFKADVEQVFQFYADTYSSPATLYYDVGFGERAGVAMKSGELGESDFSHSVSESYSSVVSQLTADATSPAQQLALASLPATDPTSNADFTFSPAQAQTLGFADAGTSSAVDPDGYVGFSATANWNYSSDPNQTPVAGEDDFFGTVEHEISEIMGRTSPMGSDKTGTEVQTGKYSLMDLYRYSAPGMRALSPFTDPSYFLLDGGTTNLADWNNYTTGNSGDLGDWSGTTVNGSVVHTPDAFNDDSVRDIINPFTANDATLMNVLGYNFTSAPVSPIPLPSTDITLSAGQLLEDLTLNEMSPGSANAPAGESYVVVDTAFDLESITGPEITQALAIGVGEFIADGAIALLQSSDTADNQVAALGTTPFVSALTVAQALADAASPPSVPTGEIMSTVVVADTAANIETLTSADVTALATTLGATEVDVSDLSGTGPLIVQDGDTYVVHGAVTLDETIDFTGSGGALEFDDTPDMKGTISGFAAGDFIDLTDIADDPNGTVNRVAHNVLDVSEHGVTYMLQLDQTQDFTGDYFHLQPDLAGTGTDISENTTPCYCRGTRIETPRGQKRVERLKIGDKVMTKSGVARPIKWIGRRSFAGRFILGRRDILPICIKAGALAGNVPRRDLWISPHHGMYFEAAYLKDASLEGALVEAKDLVNGSSIVQAERVDQVEYFHIELESHDVIVAEGALSESFLDDDSRAMFHNAHEYRALYPDAAASVAPYCAPRLDYGYGLAAVRQRIALRAGLTPSADPRQAAALRGYVDAIGPRAIEGWAQDVAAPEAPVCLDIYGDGKLLGQTLANLYREDLAQAGLGSGRHAFSFEVPSGFALAAATIEVRRSRDGRRLTGFSRLRPAA